MDKIFRVYASQGRDSWTELVLPASGHGMLDLMERLRLKPGQLPYVELLEVQEQYDYLEQCIHEQPDIYQLNALAERLSGLTGEQEMAAFEGQVAKELQQKPSSIPLPRLIDFACSTEGCALAEEAMNDFQLGKFLVENDFIEEASGLPESMTALLDFGRIGREHREAAGGVFTGFGYVEQLPEVQDVSETMDFRPRRPDYAVLVSMVALPLAGGQPGEMVQLRLPAPEEQMQEALEKLGAEDWDHVAVSILDSPLPRLNHKIYLNGELPQIAELAQCLQSLDIQGKMVKYKAVLEVSSCTELSQMTAAAGRLDGYFFEPQASSPEDVALGELNVVLSSQDAETLVPHIDLTGYGRALLERDQAIITSYGLIERDTSYQVQDMEQDAAPGGMVMG